jgi:hypothetical protein
MPGLSAFARAYYEKAFELQFIKARGTAFQDLFADTMELARPNDFIRVRPWGREGDRKNDGYLTNSRELCQCYGAYPMVKSATLAKIDEDFRGALKHWGGRFDTWAFVINDRAQGGIPAWLLEKRLELMDSHRPLQIELWGWLRVDDVVVEVVAPIVERVADHLEGPFAIVAGEMFDVLEEQDWGRGRSVVDQPNDLEEEVAALLVVEAVLTTQA